VPDVARLVVQRDNGDGAFRDVFTVDAPSTTVPVAFVDAGLAPGSYRYRLRFELDSGAEVFTSATEVDAQISTATTFDVSGDDVAVGLVLGGCAVDEITVERSYFGDPFIPVEVLMPAQDQQTISFTDRDLPPGRYVYRFNVDSPFGPPTSFVTNEEVQIRPSQDAVALSSRPNPFFRDATVDIVVRTRQDVEARLYDALGRLIAVPFSDNVGGNQRARVQIDGARLPSGVYFLHVTGESFEVMETLIRAGG
jgi:hypothetical protein